MLKQLFKSGQIVDSYIRDAIGRPIARGEIGRSVKFNGSSDYITLSSAITLNYFYDWEIEFYWIADNVTSGSALLGSTATTTKYFGGISTGANAIEFFDGANLKTCTFSNSFVNGTAYKINISYNSATGVITSNISLGFTESANTGDVRTNWGNYSINFDLLGKRGINDRYFSGNLFGLKIIIDNSEEINYYLNEGNSDGIVKDYSGNDNYGDWTIADDTFSFVSQNIINIADNALGRDTLQGICLNFDGSADYVRIPHTGVHPSATNLTFEVDSIFDVNTTGTESGRCIASCGIWGSGDNTYIGIEDSGNINSNTNLIVAFFNVSWRVLDSGITPVVGTHYNIKIIVDTAKTRMFVNDVYVGSMPYIPHSNISTSEWLIGDRHDGANSSKFDGKIWNLKVFNEVKTVENLNNGDVCNVAGWWKLDESDGAKVYDSSGNDYDGDITTATWSTQNYKSFSNELGYARGLQLLADGDMEKSGTADWTSGAGAVLSKEASSLNGGTQCLRIQDDGFGTAYQNILTIGVNYKVRGYARSDGINIARALIGTTIVFASTNSTDWQYFEAESVADAIFMQLRIDSTTSTGYVEFDQVKVEAVDIKYPVVTKSKQLLTDGDMEAVDTSAWTVARGTISKVASTLNGGAQAIELEGNSSVGAPYFYQSALLTVGKTYKMTGYAKGDGSNVPNIYIESGLGQVWLGTSSTDWQYFDLIITTTNANVLFGSTNASATTSDHVYFDEIKITELNVPECCPNIFENGDASIDDDSMMALNNSASAVLRVREHANSDNYVWRVYRKDDSTSLFPAFGQTIGSGKNIRLRCKVRTDGVNSGHVFFNGARADDQYVSTTFTNDKWYHVDVTFTTNVSYGVLFRTLSASGENGYAEFKDIEIIDLDQQTINGYTPIIYSSDSALDYSNWYGGRAKYNMVLTASNCLDFDGTNYVEYTNPGYSQDASGFKIKVRFKTGADITTAQRIHYQDQVVSGSSAYASSLLVLTGSLYCHVYTTGGDNVNMSLSINTEYELEFRYDGTTMRAILNDVLYTKVHTTGGAAYSTTAKMIIGGKESGTELFTGQVYNLEVYNSSTLLLASPMAEGVGSKVYDVSGNDNHGTWVNTPTFETQDNYHYNITNGFSIINLEGTDLDMEDSGTTAWTAANSATLEKSNDCIISSQSLRVYRGPSGTSGSAGAYQNIGMVVGTSYTISGYYKSDTGSQIASIYDGASFNNLGNATTWTKFEITIKVSSANLFLYSLGSTVTEGGFFDNITVKTAGYIPALLDGSEDVLGNEITNLGGYSFNGCETLISFPEAPELIQADINDEVLFSSGTAQTLSATDFEDVIPSQILVTNEDNYGRNIISLFDESMLVDTSIRCARGAGGASAGILMGDVLDAGTSDIKMEFYMVIPTGYTPVNYEALIGKGYVGVAVGRYYAGFSTTDFFLTTESTADGIVNILYPLTSIPKDVPVKVKCVIDRDGNQQLIIDDVLVGSDNISASSAENWNTSYNFALLGTSDGAGSKYSARVKMWDAKIWVDGVLKGWWPLDGHTYDVSGNNYHGTWNVDVPEYPALTDDELKYVDQVSYTRDYGHTIGSNELSNANDLTQASWIKRGTASAVYGVADPFGGSTASQITGLSVAVTGDCYQSISGLSGKGKYEPSFWIKPVTLSSNIKIKNSANANYGTWDIDYTQLPTGEWSYIDKTHPAVTVSIEFALSGGTNCGFHIHADSGTNEVHFYGCTLKEYFIAADSSSASGLLVNGNFNTDTIWVKANATISGGLANINSASDSYLYQSNIIENGEIYKVKFAYTLRSGSFYVGENLVNTNIFNTVGSFEEEFTFAGTGVDNKFIIRKTGGGTLDLDVFYISCSPLNSDPKPVEDINDSSLTNPAKNGLGNNQSANFNSISAEFKKR